MSMTRQEKVTKFYIQKWLSEEGYPTYANLLTDLDLNITHSPSTVAFLDPTKGRIVINGDLDRYQMSVIIRHELLHHFLKHEKRLLDHLAKKFDIDPNSLDVDDIAKGKLKSELYKDNTFNYAADYEISNRGYTDQDKQDIRNIKIGAKVVSGLVTEDDHPDWVDLSVEEMYDRLREERQKDREQNQEKKDQGDKDSLDDGSSGNSSQSSSSNNGKQSSSSSNNQQSNSSNEDSDQNSDSSSDKQNNSNDSDQQQTSESSGDDSQGSQQSNKDSDSQSDSSSKNNSDSKSSKEDKDNSSSEQQGDQSSSNSDSSSNQRSNIDDLQGSTVDSPSSRSQKNNSPNLVYGTFKNGIFIDRKGNVISPSMMRK